MSIKWVPDLGAPIAVVAIDLVTEATQPTWSTWVSYLMAAGGYVGSGMGWGGDFVKNIGIAALPGAAKNIYSQVQTGMTMESRPRNRVTSNRVRQTPSPGFANLETY